MKHHRTTRLVRMMIEGRLRASPADLARAWAEQDPDLETRAELLALVEAGDEAELSERMHAPLEFGTAGLRGVVGAGLARMNRAVVIRATRGLADTLLKKVPDSRSLPVVVGYDGRLTSRVFAEVTVAVLVAAGIPVRVFDEPVPTPIVAFAAKELSAQAAIVITASHNPPEYNGYKVYAPNAAQIVPPWDREIAEAIERVERADRVPLAEAAFDRAERVPASLIERYLDEIDAVRPTGRFDRDFPIVYTAMHGVGAKLLTRAFARAGYAGLRLVAEQSEPDGDFPTVRFPNPEEPGALDLALALARAEGAELILANDPDADRLAVCVATATGRMVQLSGNQIGVLLADLMLSQALRAPQPLVASSIVSSPMLGDIARAHGARFEQTLTGFKWIWNAALDLERDEHLRFCFGYEEALGYSVGRIVRDKDGISAALLFADLAARCRAEGTTILEHLHRLYVRHGLWVSVQRSVTLPGAQGAARIAAAMQRIGSAPPSEVDGFAVSEVVDFREGGEARPRWLPNTELIALMLGPRGRVLVRPSGTEPKLKIYVDLRAEVDAPERISELESATLELAQSLAGGVASSLGLAD